MSRKDLASIVEQQKQQISLYQTKLRDVVRECKVLQKERDALQTALTALTAATDKTPENGSDLKYSSNSLDQTKRPSNNPNPRQNDGKIDSQLLSQIVSSTSISDVCSDNIRVEVSGKNCENPPCQKKTDTAISESTSFSEEENNEKDCELKSSKLANAPEQDNLDQNSNSPCDDIPQEEAAMVYNLQKQLQSVSLAMTEIAAEKEKMLKSFMIERKKIAEEKDKLNSDIISLEAAKRAALASAQELHHKIRQLQTDRDADNDEAATRLRECQRVVSEQREARQRAEMQLQQAQHRLLQRSTQQYQQCQADVQQQQQNKQVTELKNIICQLESRLASSETELQQKQAELLQVQQLHAAAASALHQESLRAQEAEAAAARAVHSAREREAALEVRLADVASCVANNASLDTTAALQQYKARVRELTEHNQELTQKVVSLESANASGNTDTSSRLGGDRVLSSDGNTEQEAEYLLKHVKKLWLQLQLMPLKQAQRLQLENLLGGGDLLHETCRQQHSALLQQLHAATSSSNKDAGGSPDGVNNTTNTISAHEAEVAALRQQLRSVTSAAQEAEAGHAEQVAHLKQDCRRARTEAEERLVSAQQSHRAVVCSLEQQLTSQRLHSIATLQERDVELHRLQQQLHCYTADTVQPGALVCSSAAAAGRSGPLLHHVEELQRRQCEVAALQHEKLQLEQAVRELQQAEIERRMMHEERMEHVEMQLERYHRNQSRESQNLEYLKNVLLHFLTSSEGSNGGNGTAMLKAVAAVLKLSPKEEERLRKNSKAGDGWWWWGGGKQGEAGK